MIRLGLCCIFRDEPTRFRTTTAAVMKKLRRQERLAKRAGICLGNAEALLQTLQYCSCNGIGFFRINSQILPLNDYGKVVVRPYEEPPRATPAL
jgi:UV DNA damage endonuclease